MQRRVFLGRAAAAAAVAALPMTAFSAQKKEVPFPVKGKVTVVDFGAPWCASCPEMAELMKQMQKEYGDRAAFVVINIDEWQGIEDEYLIEEMPAQIFFDNKGEPIWQHTGPVDAETMRDRVDTLLRGPIKKN